MRKNGIDLYKRLSISGNIIDPESANISSIHTNLYFRIDYLVIKIQR